MFSKKKIVEELFPKLSELPQQGRKELLQAANDGSLLFEPPSYKALLGKHYCYKCGSAGELASNSNLICPKCGNSNCRGFKKSERESMGQEYRYVCKIDDHIVIRDYLLRIREDCNNCNVYVEELEHCRIIIQNKRKVCFESNVFCSWEHNKKWSCVKKPAGYHRQIKVVFENEELQFDPQIKEIEFALTYNSADLYLAIEHLSVNAVVEKVMPRVEFDEVDYSCIKTDGSPMAVSIYEDIPGSKQFKKMKSWCSVCGKYNEKIADTTYDVSNDKCCICGSIRYAYRDCEHYVIDGKETPDGGFLLRVQGITKLRVFENNLVEHINPTINIKYTINYVEYVLISNVGEITLFNSFGKEVEKMHTKKPENRSSFDVYF